MTKSPLPCLLLALSSLAWSCGPARPAGPTTPGSEPDDDGEGAGPAPDRDDGMAVEGLSGTLRRDEVDPVMNRAMSQLMRCYATELDEHPFLLGDVAMSFTVGPDGSVDSVRVTSSTLGSRAAMDCILGVARRLSFPRPHGGGQAQFDYGPVMFNPGEAARPLALWDRARVSEVLDAEENAAALDQCPAVGVSVTFYVGPGGRVRSIGAVPPSPDAEEAARCFEAVLSGFQFSDPHPEVAKVTLEF